MSSKIPDDDNKNGSHGKYKHSQQSLSDRLILESFKKAILRWEVEQQLNY